MSGQPHIDPVVPRARVANIANVLTGVRMVLVPVFLALLFVGDGHETFWRIAAFVVFAVAVITDRFDGALARSYGMVTEFGKRRGKKQISDKSYGCVAPLRATQSAPHKP